MNLSSFKSSVVSVEISSLTISPSASDVTVSSTLSTSLSLRSVSALSSNLDKVLLSVTVTVTAVVPILSLLHHGMLQQLNQCPHHRLQIHIRLLLH